jgi:hypothetical protein
MFYVVNARGFLTLLDSPRNHSQPDYTKAHPFYTMEQANTAAIKALGDHTPYAIMTQVQETMRCTRGSSRITSYITSDMVRLLHVGYTSRQLVAVDALAMFRDWPPAFVHTRGEDVEVFEFDTKIPMPSDLSASDFFGAAQYKIVTDPSAARELNMCPNTLRMQGLNKPIKGD